MCTPLHIIPEQCSKCSGTVNGAPCRSFAPKQRRHFEIFRKGDGHSLVHLLGIKAVYAKIIDKDVR